MILPLYCLIKANDRYWNREQSKKNSDCAFETVKEHLCKNPVYAIEEADVTYTACPCSHNPIKQTCANDDCDGKQKQKNPVCFADFTIVYLRQGSLVLFFIFFGCRPIDFIFSHKFAPIVATFISTRFNLISQVEATV